MNAQSHAVHWTRQEEGLYTKIIECTYMFNITK